MELEKTVLEGRFVRLEPLSELHEAGLCEAVSDGKLWELFVTLVPTVDQVPQFIEDALKAFESGDGLAFATIDKATGRIAGSTRFMKANLTYKKIEIGYTFLGKSWQRSSINTEAKLLMLTHAFEHLELNRVELLTDFLNEKSRRAISRLGAKKEGVLRSHIIMPDGRVRDSVIYSIIKNEWPGVKQHLSHKLMFS